MPLKPPRERTEIQIRRSGSRPFGKAAMMKKLAGICLAAILAAAGVARAANPGDVVTLHNAFISRELTFDGHVWRTTRFARADNTDAVPVQSDEFHILFPDNTE